MRKTHEQKMADLTARVEKARADKPPSTFNPKYKRAKWALNSNGNNYGPGWVYLIAMEYPGGGTVYKIGCTGNHDPMERISKINGSLPFKVHTIGLIETENMNMLEVRLHSIFEKKRLKGEWFRLTDRQVRKFFTVFEFLEPAAAIAKRRSRFLAEVRESQNSESYRNQTGNI